MPDCPHCGGYIPPPNVANLPDLITLLSMVRDALDSGHGDLAQAVLHLVVEHQANLGRRSRTLGRRLREQLAEREAARDPQTP